MQIEVMNSHRGEFYGGMNSLSRTTYEMNGLSRIPQSDLMDGLSRLELMSDDEMDDTLGKLRIRFGKGKGKARRQEKKRLRLLAKAIQKKKKAEKKASLRIGRKKQVAGIKRFVEGIASSIGGGRRPEDVGEAALREILLDEPDVVPWKDRKTLGLKNPTAVAVYGGGGALILGTVIYYATRKKRKKKRR